MSRTHLSDDRLIELCLAASVPDTSATADRFAEDADHLIGCAACEIRRVELTHLLDEVGQAADLEADAAFPVDRLARQQARILHRIDQDGRPARVIAFPAGHGPETTLPRSHRTTRWVAGAAAAAFVIGLLTGHLAHDFPTRGVRRAPAPQLSSAAPARTSPGVIRTVQASDDAFLGEIDLAVASGGPAALRRIDAVTPRAWEVGR
jgi:hypothetical protein